jgi:hypothetical protein
MKGTQSLLGAPFNAASNVEILEITHVEEAAIIGAVQLSLRMCAIRVALPYALGEEPIRLCQRPTAPSKEIVSPSVATMAAIGSIEGRDVLQGGVL